EPRYQDARAADRAGRAGGRGGGANAHGRADQTARGRREPGLGGGAVRTGPDRARRGHRDLDLGCGTEVSRRQHQSARGPRSFRDRLRGAGAWRPQAAVGVLAGGDGMRDVMPALKRWWEASTPVGMGTVVATWRSAPRQAGAAMLVGPDGEAVGSVSGGCVEGAVYELATAVTADGVPVLQRYGVSDEDAFAVGLTCGGIIDVFVERVDRASFPQLGDVIADVEAGRPVAVCTLIEHPDPARVGVRLVVWAPAGEAATSGTSGTMGSARFDYAVADDALGLLESGRTETLVYGPDGERRGEGARVFVSSFAPRPRMIVFGAIDFASALAKMGSFLGYRVTVCDARPVFATHSRFPDADEVVVSWPHEYLAAQADEGLIDSR